MLIKAYWKPCWSNHAGQIKADFKSGRSKPLKSFAGQSRAPPGWSKLGQRLILARQSSVSATRRPGGTTRKAHPKPARLGATASKAWARHDRLGRRRALETRIARSLEEGQGKRATFAAGGSKGARRTGPDCQAEGGEIETETDRWKTRSKDREERDGGRRRETEREREQEGKRGRETNQRERDYDSRKRG